MGVDYTPFLGVGLTFDYFDDVCSFLLAYDTPEDVDVFTDDLEDIANHFHVHIEYFGMDDIYFVGYTVSDGDIRTEFIPDINKALQRFETKFPEHKPELVHLVNTF
jgi:hypothetical protein